MTGDVFGSVNFMDAFDPISRTLSIKPDVAIISWIPICMFDNFSPDFILPADIVTAICTWVVDDLFNLFSQFFGNRDIGVDGKNPVGINQRVGKVAGGRIINKIMMNNPGSKLFSNGQGLVC